MDDNALIDLVCVQLEAASAMFGWNYLVVQKNEPSQEGVPTAPTIFFEKLFDKPYGFPMVESDYQSEFGNFAEVETQLYETTFQISALVPQDPTNLTIPTASDVANYLCMYMKTRTVVAILMQAEVGILRVTDVRNPYFVDDRERFEASPSFDLILTHKRVITMTVPAVDKIVGAPSTIPGDNTKGVFVVLDGAGETVGHGA